MKDSQVPQEGKLIVLIALP